MNDTPNTEGEHVHWTQRDKKTLASSYCVDGLSRSPEQERQLNEAVSIAFSGKVGETVLDYLKSITINMVSGPHVSNDQLRHLEGQRFIVSIIEQRKRDHADKKPKT